MYLVYREDSVFGNYVLKYSDDQMFEIEKTSGNKD